MACAVSYHLRHMVRLFTVRLSSRPPRFSKICVRSSAGRSSNEVMSYTCPVAVEVWDSFNVAGLRARAAVLIKDTISF